MRTDLWGSNAAVSPARDTGPPGREPPPAAAVTALYQAHALGLIRLAHIILGDRQSAEDVVQEAFYGLYRRWGHLSDTGNALRYLRSSVLNGSRSLLRRRTPRERPGLSLPEVSAEAAVLSGEERQQVMAAVRRLPRRQREALVLRFYLDLSEGEIAATMGIGQSTVRSATHRALASLGRMLQEES
jgi:RNA polymerase sigma-70 factor (sigma-E family)